MYWSIALHKLFVWNFGLYLHKSKMEVKINGVHINLPLSHTFHVGIVLFICLFASLTGVVCGYFLGKYCGKYISVRACECEPVYVCCSCRHHRCDEKWRECSDENQLQNTNTKDIKRTSDIALIVCLSLNSHGILPAIRSRLAQVFMC